MTKKERLALVKECRASGITAKAWCEAKVFSIGSKLASELRPVRIDDRAGFFAFGREKKNERNERVVNI
jgi:hypothetical protein